jgi:hypothetical protein
MSERDYRIVRQPETGQFLCVERNSDGKRFLLNGPEYKDFLAWNESQDQLLNVAHRELPKGHVVTSDTKTVVETCR